ncbi:hypothetical protein [Dendronalium sp. ChiSLP03b]|uniref:hypothetical protein n=1 Tax=Dendronalium sp. ChiSLP03b TaxID=3075381 RepID=UPI002AD4E833|nr:hypothetical protein [Dendronalium sp. ChiSLP03b]MDZ8204953.1 hypothetical protein [Dendronalium sp. ChiSLP03b]
MSIVKRLPWISLVLVLLSYSALGWVLAESQVPRLVWLVFVPIVLFVVGSLTAPLSLMTQYSSILFRSNIRTFSVAVFGAFLFFLMLAWFRLFLDCLLIFSAAILARIDFQVSGFTEGQAFWITCAISLVGIALGAGIYQGVLHHVSL